VIFFNNTTILKSGVLSGLNDVHSHILFGVDDGIGTLDESLQTLSLMEEAGVATVWCTPHIMEEVPNKTDALKERFEKLCEAYYGMSREEWVRSHETGGTVEGSKILLRLSAENMLDRVFKERMEAGDLLMHEGDLLLVETSYYNPPMQMKDTLRDILHAGMRPLLAHPERYQYMDEKDYRELREMGIAFQLNLGSLVGAYGKPVQKKAEYLLKNGYYSKVGIDTHSKNFLAFVMKSKIDKGIAKLVKEIR